MNIHSEYGTEQEVYKHLTKKGDYVDITTLRDYLGDHLLELPIKKYT